MRNEGRDVGVELDEGIADSFVAVIRVWTMHQEEHARWVGSLDGKACSVGIERVVEDHDELVGHRGHSVEAKGCEEELLFIVRQEGDGLASRHQTREGEDRVPHLFCDQGGNAVPVGEEGLRSEDVLAHEQTLTEVTEEGHHFFLRVERGDPDDELLPVREDERVAGDGRKTKGHLARVGAGEGETCLLVSLDLVEKDDLWLCLVGGQEKNEGEKDVEAAFVLCFFFCLW